jgi:hypothetical protein
MNTKKPQACDVTENRFRTTLMFLRMAGFPVNMKKTSVQTSVYNVLVMLHGYALYLSFLIDSIVHRDDLKRFMESFRILIVTSLLVWLVLNVR